MRIEFWYFAGKKRNSTQRPVSGSAEFVCTTATWKKPFDLLHPTIEIMREDNQAGTNSMFNYNYCYIERTGRYYFIDTWESFPNSMWVGHLTVDVLASFKEQIGVQSYYVLRSHSKVDSRIIDGLYPMTNDIDSETTFAKRNDLTTNLWQNNSPWESDIISGIYVIGIINSDSGSGGAINYYAFTNSQFNTFKSMLLDEANFGGDWSDLEISQPLFKSLFNPIQYIASCMWFPISNGNITNIAGSNVTDLKFGWWTFNSCPCKKLSDLVWITDVFYFNPPSHPQADEQYSDAGLPYLYLNHTPYTEAKLYFPPFGEFDIDLSELGYKEYTLNPRTLTDFSYLTGAVKVDLITGEGHLLVSVTDPYDHTQYHPILWQTAKVGVDIALAQVTNDVIGIAGGALQTAGGVASAFFGNVGGAMSGIANGIINAARAAIPMATKIGSTGSLSEYGVIEVFLLYRYRRTVERKPYTFGFPLCKNVRIDTLSGFIQIADQPIVINSSTTVPMDTEIQMIKDFMVRGFYYE